MDKHLFEKWIASFRYFLRVFKILFRAGKFYVIAICCTGIILGITPSVSLLVMQRIINLLQLKTVEYKQFLVLFVIYIAIDVGQSGCGLIMNYCEQRIQLAGSLYVQMSILEKVSEFRLKNFESSEIYDILQRAMQVNFTRIYNYFKSFLVAFGNLEKIEATSEIKKLISDVGLAENFRNLDEQLGSWFENGKQLSGGEWLKIALARAFIRDADLYLLDEPNSALDPISEKIVFNSFKKLVKNKIGIVVSHRISSIKDIADQIVVFNNGKIEAIGSHEELLKKSVTYHNLYMNETQNCHILK